MTTILNELIAALDNFLKRSPILASDGEGKVEDYLKVEQWYDLAVMLKTNLQNNLYDVLVSVRQLSSEAGRFHKDPKGCLLPLLAVEVYEVLVWMVDAPKYRLHFDMDLLGRVVEEVRRFFYNNSVFGCEKTVKNLNHANKTQLVYCTQILVTRVNQDLPDYKQQ
ncbi:MAG: hypothetical protein LBC12_00435 [Nitrososphaerota archaeon]|jgi:hypothetical protein|nr:hypothetical protein [Nitrososphaerota archaeon]